MAISYETWKGMMDAIESSDSLDLAEVLTPFLVELGPFAPLVSAALAIGGKGLVKTVVEGLPHEVPAGIGIRAEEPSLKPAPAKPAPKIGLPLTTLRAPKHSEDVLESYSQFISPYKPLIPREFSKRPVQHERVDALVYRDPEPVQHTRPRKYNEVGPNATVNRIGF